jgi:hypothetical protein
MNTNVDLELSKLNLRGKGASVATWLRNYRDTMRGFGNKPVLRLSRDDYAALLASATRASGRSTARDLYLDGLIVSVTA